MAAPKPLGKEQQEAAAAPEQAAVEVGAAAEQNPGEGEAVAEETRVGAAAERNPGEGPTLVAMVQEAEPKPPVHPHQQQLAVAEARPLAAAETHPLVAVETRPLAEELRVVTVLRTLVLAVARQAAHPLVLLPLARLVAVMLRQQEEIRPEAAAEVPQVVLAQLTQGPEVDCSEVTPAAVVLTLAEEAVVVLTLAEEAVVTLGEEAVAGMRRVDAMLRPVESDLVRETVITR